MAGCYKREEEILMADYTRDYVSWVIAGRDPKGKPQSISMYYKKIIALEMGIEKAFVDCAMTER